jgi:hypothetical protein
MHKKKAILVLGVHRSGTSAFTRVLGLCGATLPTRLLDAIPGDNDKGFWEPSRINSIHEELLRSLESSWDDISDFPQTWFTTHEAENYKNRLLLELKEDFSDTNLFIIKEPRMCRLVPLWSDVLAEFGAEPLVLIPVRNPLEVAASLKARDGFQQEKSLLLWLQNFLAAERDSRLMKRTFISYGQLMDDWKSVVNKISSDLGINWPEHSQENILKINEFLTPNLRHHSFHTKDVETSTKIVTWVKQAYQWALAATQNAGIDSSLLNEIAEKFEDANSAYFPIIDQLQKENKQLKHELAAVLPKLKDCDNQLSWLKQALPAREQELASIKQVLLEKEKELASIKQVLLEKEKELASIKQVLLEKEKELDSIKFVLSEREKELDSIKFVLTEREKELDSIKRSLSQ